MSRTPGQWDIDNEGIVFSIEEQINVCSLYPFNRKANAKFILTACNNHDRLTAALEEVSEYLHDDPNDEQNGELNRICKVVRQALAAVKEAPDA